MYFYAMPLPLTHVTPAPPASTKQGSCCQHAVRLHYLQDMLHAVDVDELAVLKVQQLIALVHLHCC